MIRNGFVAIVFFCLAPLALAMPPMMIHVCSLKITNDSSAPVSLSVKKTHPDSFMDIIPSTTINPQNSIKLSNSGTHGYAPCGFSVTFNNNCAVTVGLAGATITTSTNTCHLSNENQLIITNN